MARRFMSLKNLKEWFPKVEEEKLVKLRQLMKDELDIDEEVEALIEQGKLETYVRRYSDVEKMLQIANVLLDGYGVEAVEGGVYVDRYWRYHALWYINQGDTYDATLLYRADQDLFKVGSWGGETEAVPKLIESQ